MRSVIARKTIIPILSVFLLLMLGYFAASYEYFTSLVTEDNKTWLSDISSTISIRLNKKQIDNDMDFVSEFERISNEICMSFDVDYTSIYVPDTDNNTITFLSIIYNQQKEDCNTDSYLSYALSNAVNTKISKSELQVLNGEKEIGFVSYNNKYGYELAAVTKQILPSGKTALISVEKSYKTINSEVANVLRIQTLGIIGVYFLTCFVLYMVIRKYVSEPAMRISNAMNSFAKDNKKINLLKADANRNDEFGVINRAFNSMTDSIEKYIEDIVNLNDIRQKQQAEVEVASRIQKGLLPDGKSFFNGCRISAMMQPATEVGGDLYDYFEIDEDNTLITIADVSGKGVGASVFMAITLALLHQFADMKMGPAEIFEKTNKLLCERNAMTLFVTAFIGIYNKKSMTLTYSNAGHNHPYLLSDSVKTIDGACSSVLGLFRDEKYSQQTMLLNPGETVLLYTDGVTEAVNGNNEFFGIKRLEQTLSQFRPFGQASLVDDIRHQLEIFSGDTTQYDDITMLSLTAEKQEELYLCENTSEFIKIKNLILNSSVEESMKLALCLISEEIFVNICSYAFEGIQAVHEIKFILKTSDRIAIRFEDNGIKYNPLENLQGIDDYNSDKQIGGLGKIIAFGIADEVNYKYRDGKNILTMIKYREKN